MIRDKLRTFEHFPKDSVCPICGKNDDKECILLPIVGTQEDNIAQAQVVHTGCLDLWYDAEHKIIYQTLE